MANETQNKPIEQIQKLEQFLPEKKQEDLAQILAFGEKYKADSSDAEYNFWSKYGLKEYRQLLSQYELSKQKFLAGLTPQEKKILDSIPVTVKDKFFREYLFDWILYSGDAENEESLKPGMSIDLFGKGIGDEGAKAIAKEWKNNLKPGMQIDLSKNGIGPEGAKIIAEERKDSLQPWMFIALWGNNIGPEGAKAIAENWKNKLQPGMDISLTDNKIGTEGAKIIAKEWKISLKPGMEIGLGDNEIGPVGAKAIAEKWRDNLQPGMTIYLFDNELGDVGAEAIAEERKYKLQPGMKISLHNNKIGDKGAEAIMHNMELKNGVTIALERNDISEDKKQELKDWEKSYQDQGIMCHVLVE